MKSIKDVTSLLSTLEFLEHSGAGEPLADLPSIKSDLTVCFAKKLFPRILKVKNKTDFPAAANKDNSSFDKVTDHKISKRTVVPQLKTNHTHISDAQRLADNSQSLEELQNAVMTFEGCGLKHTAMNTVFSDGNPKADIMLIGEAPGADEDRQGLPFVGISGQLLDKMLYAIGKTRQDDYYIANVIPWRPPGNRPPTLEETRICLPFIKRHIELKKPKVLIFIGATAAKTLLNTKESMSKLRGKWFDYKVSPDEGSVPATVLFHPAYLIRSPGQKKHAWADLLKIKHSLENQSFSV